MRRSLLAVAVLVLSGLAAGTAHADHLNTELGPYSTLLNNTTEKTVFGWNEQPFVYFQFDRDDLNLSEPLVIKWKWQHAGDPPTATEEHSFFSIPTDPFNIWNSVDNWDVHKQLGDWTVKTKWSNVGVGSAHHTVHFTVTPEPFGALMVLVGGVAFAAFTGTKKRKANVS